MKARAAMQFLGRWLLRALLGAGAVALGGCGGGDQVASGGIVGTGISIASIGSISRIGSVTVNGVRFATTNASVTVDGAAAPESALKVGMVVTVQGQVFPDGSATAASVDARTEVKGVVSGVDSATRSFTVLGQRLRTDQLTVFAGGTFDTLLDQYVEVSGFRGAPGELLATRVEISAVVVPGARLGVTGPVAAYDALAKTFAIGAQTIDFSQVGSAFLPRALGNGAKVEVEGQLRQGVLVASRIEVEQSGEVVVDATVEAVDGAGFTLGG